MKKKGIFLTSYLQELLCIKVDIRTGIILAMTLAPILLLISFSVTGVYFIQCLVLSNNTIWQTFFSLSIHLNQPSQCNLLLKILRTI